jgi:1-acyl-sn-glycerol-3-phosphate acyltransferase
VAETTFPPLTSKVRRHASFDRVRQIGPSIEERVTGSPQLRSRQRLGRRLSRAMGRLELSGLERIPPIGPVILAANHQSFMDGPLLFGFVDRVVSCLVKAEAFAPVAGQAGQLLIGGAQIPVLRGEIDAAPVRLALEVLNAGGVLGIFPEGTRGNGQMTSAMPGVGYFARKTGAIVVPIAIHGSAMMTHGRRINRPRVRIVVGEPLAFERARPGRPLDRRDWIAATEQIRLAIAELVSTTELLNTMTVSTAPSKAKAQR